MRQAAMTILIFNLLIGIIYLCIDIPLIGSRQIVTEDWEIPFVMVGVILCATCIVIYVIVSLLTPRPSEEQLKDLCWEHPLESIRTGAVKSVTDPRIMAGILFVLMIVLYCLIWVDKVVGRWYISPLQVKEIKYTTSYNEPTRKNKAWRRCRADTCYSERSTAGEHYGPEGNVTGIRSLQIIQ